MSGWARWSPRLLGALLVAEGAGKLLDFAGYVRALGALVGAGGGGVRALAAVWMATELAAGIALVLARGPSLAGAVGACAANVGYAVATFSAFVRGAHVDNCTCFGVFLAQRLSGWVLAQDVSMLVWTFSTLRAAWRKPPA